MLMVIKARSWKLEDSLHYSFYYFQDNMKKKFSNFLLKFWLMRQSKTYLSCDNKV